MMNWSEYAPQTGLGNENTVVATDCEVHHPVVEVATENLSDEDSDL